MSHGSLKFTSPNAELLPFILQISPTSHHLDKWHPYLPIGSVTQAKDLRVIFDSSLPSYSTANPSANPIVSTFENVYA